MALVSPPSAKTCDGFRCGGGWRVSLGVLLAAVLPVLVSQSLISGVVDRLWAYGNTRIVWYCADEISLLKFFIHDRLAGASILDILLERYRRIGILMNAKEKGRSIRSDQREDPYNE